VSEWIQQKELAERLNLSPRQIRNLVEAGMSPTDMQGGKKVYGWPECSHWYVEYKIQSAAPKADKHSERMAELELQKEELAIRAAALKLGKEEGRLLDVEYVEQQLEACLSAVRGKLLNFSGKWAPHLVGLRTPAKARVVLERAVREVLTELVIAGADPDIDDAETGNVD
jgi:hypothetical protein